MRRAPEDTRRLRPDPEPSIDEKTVTVRVPLAIRKRGGRKRVVAPDGTEGSTSSPPGQVSTLVKALARAHRWQRMLESGEYSSIAELAAAEKINPSYLARVLRLTLLAPEIVEGLAAGRRPSGDAFAITALMEWRQQSRLACQG